MSKRPCNAAGTHLRVDDFAFVLEQHFGENHRKLRSTMRNLDCLNAECAAYLDDGFVVRVEIQQQRLRLFVWPQRAGQLGGRRNHTCSGLTRQVTPTNDVSRTRPHTCAELARFELLEIVLVALELICQLLQSNNSA
jgi:hypothetical protein